MISTKKVERWTFITYELRSFLSQDTEFSRRFFQPKSMNGTNFALSWVLEFCFMPRRPELNSDDL